MLLFVGCANEKINTIIEEDNNVFISLNYPITNIKKLDKKIKKDVDNIYDDFKKNCIKDSELNIDYTYNKNNNYISIVLKIYINTNEKKEYVKTYFYDINKNKFLDINDIIDGYKNIYFSIDNEYFYTYINNDSNYIKNEYQLKNLNLKINIEKIETKKTNILYESNNKVLNPKDKFIALTFDDGPSIYSSSLLKVLEDNNINATFFILGNKVKIYNNVLNQSLKDGNELGNHSYNHKWLIKLDEDDLKTQIDDTQNIIKQYTGYTPTLFRPTYGSINDKVKKASDLDIVLWTIDTLDWKYNSVNRIVNNATKRVKDGDIILMHETYKRTVEAVKQIIPILKNKGFTFVTVSELREIQKLRNYES